MKYKIAFFGGEPLGVPTLEELHTRGIVPDLIVCNPDRPHGRGQQVKNPPVKDWALSHEVEVFQPTSYKDKSSLERLINEEWDLFVVVAYNFILPAWLLEIPKHGVLNVHPSLLPKLRGSSPIRTAILTNDREAIGVTIMLLDDAMDHGPILAQVPIPIDDAVWPIRGSELDAALARTGGALLAATIPDWLAGTITPTEQNHDLATYTKRFQKGDNELELNPFNLPTGEDAREILHTIYAWDGIGDTYFLYNNKRVKIKAADLSAGGSLKIKRVIPEGKKEMDFTSYLQSLAIS